MKYDPIKNSLGGFFNRSVFLRKLFYRLLGLLLLRTWHIKRAIKKWERSVSGEQHILDAGSGFGQYTFFLASRNKNWKITAVDIKNDQIEDCRSFFKRSGFENAEFHRADLTKYYKDNAFDLILSVDVMEHIEDDTRVFINFHRSLKQGGMLLISTPSDQGGSDVHHHDESHKDTNGDSFIDEHVRDGYNITEIQDKLKEAGFNKAKASYQYGCMGNISWYISMKYPLLMLNVSKLFFLILPIYYLITFPFCLLLNYIDVRKKNKTGTGLIVKAYK